MKNTPEDRSVSARPSREKSEKDRDRSLNPDPLTGETGSHPVGTGLGAAGGGAAGMAVGAVLGGPVGAAIGGAVGAIAGGAAGHGIAEQIDPTVEDRYWSEQFSRADYFEKGRPYSDYQPAYRYGWESRAAHPEKSWDQVEQELGSRWRDVRDRSGLEWEKARHAARDAWHRVERNLPGDADRDGR